MFTVFYRSFPEHFDESQLFKGDQQKLKVSISVCRVTGFTWDWENLFFSDSGNIVRIIFGSDGIFTVNKVVFEKFQYVILIFNHVDP